MKVSLDAPYASVHLLQGGLHYGKQSQGKICKGQTVTISTQIPENNAFSCRSKNEVT